MSITITKVGSKYVAEVTPPHGSGTPWTSARPVTRDDLIATLRELGCHKTDIGDGFHAADPSWLD
jgi:hypothetical protein